MSFDRKVALKRSKRTDTKLGRMFEAELVPVTNILTGKKEVHTRLHRRPETLPASPRTPYTFEMDGLRITVLLSNGQIINKYKAFKRFCEERGGYGTAIRAQNMLDPKDWPQLTRVDENNKIIA